MPTNSVCDLGKPPASSPTTWDAGLDMSHIQQHENNKARLAPGTVSHTLTPPSSRCSNEGATWSPFLDKETEAQRDEAPTVTN